MERKKQGRRQAVLSAAEGVMQSEWVCGEEGRVELELLNPLAVPVKIDSISLYARYSPAAPPATSAAAASGQAASAAATAAGGAGAEQQAAGSSRWRSLPMQLVLPPNGKPVRIQLKGTALVPGNLTLTGVRVSALGAWWFEPFGFHLPKPSAGLGSGLGVGAPGNLKALQQRLGQSDTGAAVGGSRWRQINVTALPLLPLLQAVLRRRDPRRGEAEVLASGPFPDEPAGAAAHSSSPTASAAAAAAPPPPSIPRVPSLASLQARRTVSVWQGQRCTWELQLTNVGGAAVSSLQLAVANQRGALLKPLPQGHVRASFVGVHLEAGPGAAAGLAAGLPLEPGASLVVPMEMHAGQPPGDAYEELVLEVRIAYTGPSTDPASPDPSKELLGRQLSLPVQFQVQRTVQVSGLQFLDLMLPVKDGVRCRTRHGQQEPDAGPVARSASYTLSPRPRLGKQVSGISRDHAALSGPDLRLVDSSGALALWPQDLPSFSRHSEPQLLWQQQEDAEIDLSSGPGLSPSSTSLAAGSSRAAAAAAPEPRPQQAGGPGAVTRVGLDSECLLEVTVASACERYLRVWLEPVPSPGREEGGAEPGPSGSAVLPPGEVSTMRCGIALPCVHESDAGAAAGGTAAAGGQLVLGGEPDRLAAAEALCSSWAVAWRMIAPGEEEGNAPCGIVQLAAVDVARSLNSRAIACLQPSQLSFGISALYPLPAGGAAAGGSARPRVQDLTRRMQDLDIRGGGQPAETWGLRLGLGEVVELQVEVSSCSCTSTLLQFSLGAANMACPTDRATDLSDPAMAQGTSAAGCGVDSGVLLMGQIEKVRCRVEPSSSQVHLMSVMFVQPGLYQLYVYDVLAAQHCSTATLGEPRDWASASKVYANVQQLNVLCL